MTSSEKARSKPWTSAMEKTIAEFTEANPEQWMAEKDLIAVGVASVPDERALREPTAERRGLDVARETVARQSLLGMERFGKIEFQGPRNAREVRATTPDRKSLGALGKQIQAQGEQLQILERRVVRAEDQLAAVVKALLAVGGRPDKIWPFPNTGTPTADSTSDDTADEFAEIVDGDGSQE